MDQQEFIMYMKEALQLPEIKCLIVQAAGLGAGYGNIVEPENDHRKDKEIERLRDECLLWQEKERALQIKIGDMDERFLTMQKQSNDLKMKLKRTEKQLSGFVNVFGRFYSMLEVYDNLSENHKNALKGIFKEDTPDSWIAAGVQPDNIDSLWEYTRMQIMNRKYKELEGLGSLVYYFLDLYNSTRSTPIFTLQEVSAGDMFDVDSHIRTSDSKAAGRISQVYLYGYVNVNTDTVIKRSVVMV